MAFKWFAVVLFVGTCVIGITNFLESGQKIVAAADAALKKPKVDVLANVHTDGTATIVYKFFDIPKEKNVDWMILKFQQTQPVISIQGNPSKRIQPVRYDVLVPEDIFDQENSELEIETRLVQEKDEPYALAQLDLRWSKPGTSVTFIVETVFLDAMKEKIEVTENNGNPEITLSNYPASKH